MKARAKAAKQEPQPQAATRPTPLARLRSFGWRAARPAPRGRGGVPKGGAQVDICGAAIRRGGVRVSFRVLGF